METKDRMAEFVAVNNCPNCSQSGGMSLTGQEVYGAPLKFEYSCDYCEHTGFVGYRSIQEPVIVFKLKNKSESHR